MSVSDPAAVHPATAIGAFPDRPPVPAAIAATRVLAILRRVPPAAASDVVAALVDGGIRAVEITLDSEGALDLIARLRETHGEDLTIAAGTVVGLAAARSALAAGADMMVSPHTDVAMVATLAAEGVACVPGTFTASEIVTAWQAGAAAVKVFPVSALGAGGVRDLCGPLGFIPLMCSGGVTVEVAPALVAAGAYGVGMGSTLVDLGAGPEVLTARAWALIDAVAAARR